MSSCFDFVTNEEKKFIKQEARNIFDFDLHLLYAYTKLEENLNLIETGFYFPTHLLLRVK